MAQRRFFQVNVFSEESYLGNPVAVVRDSENLTDLQMQQFANWTNLSETTFISLPIDSSADYHLRIFTPSKELPFAGHPTLGSCAAWLRSGGIPKNSNFIIQECEKGLIRIKIENEILSFEAPPLNKSGPLNEEEVQIIANSLNLQRSEIIAHSWCDNGPRWRAVLLDSSTKILSLKPNPLLLGDFDFGVIGPRCKIGVIAPNNQQEDDTTDNNDDYDYEVRAFSPLDLPFEDPVTGSLNAGIAQWFFSSGIVNKQSYCVQQGTVLGRKGRIYVTAQDIKESKEKEIWIGGKCTICIEGSVYI